MDAGDGELARLLDDAARVNVPRAVQVGCDLPSARWTVELVAREPRLVGAVALHPNEAPRLAQRGDLEQAMVEIDALARSPRIRCIGETGLDYGPALIAQDTPTTTRSVSSPGAIGAPAAIGAAARRYITGD